MSADNRSLEEEFPQTWYRVAKYHDVIEPVTVLKVTDCFVTVNDSYYKRPVREAKNALLHPTWESAHAFLVERITTNAKYHRDQAHKCDSSLGAVVKLRKPE